MLLIVSVAKSRGVRQDGAPQPLQPGNVGHWAYQRLCGDVDEGISASTTPKSRPAIITPHALPMFADIARMLQRVFGSDIRRRLNRAVGQLRDRRG